MKTSTKIIYETARTLLALARPIIGNRRFSKIYCKLLHKCGVDIAPFDACGFISPTVEFDKYSFNKIHIGQNVYLTHDVILLVHDQSAVTAWNSQNREPNSGSLYKSKDIWIGNNVFIGMRSIILPGTVIEDNVVIGAGSVVTGHIKGSRVYVTPKPMELEGIKEYYQNLSGRGELN